MSSQTHKPWIWNWFRNSLGVFIVIAALPIAIMVNFPMWLLGLHGVKRTPEEVASYLRKFSEGTEGPWDWDDFEIPIRDPRLEIIRQEAMTVALPLRPVDRAKLGELLMRVEALIERP